MIAQSIQAFSHLFDVSFVLIGNRTRNGARPDHIGELVFVEGPNFIETIANLVLRRTKTIQEAFFFSKKAQAYIKGIISDDRVKAVACDMVRASEYIMGTHDRIKICDMDDLLSRRYKQIGSQKGLISSPFGTHSDRHLFGLLNFISRPLIKHIMRLEARLMNTREKQVAKAVDLVILVSPVEQNILKSAIPDGAEIVAFPPAKKPMLWEPIAEGIYENKASGNGPSLIFVGDMRTPANGMAVDFILDVIVPELERRIPSFDLAFIGKATKNLVRRIDETPMCRYVGWVESLNGAYANCDIVLCPLISGTGIKLKVLEGMAHAKAVITNSVGAEGLEAKAGQDFFVCERPDEIAELIRDLTIDTRKRIAVGRSASRYVRRKHDPDFLTTRLLEVVRRLPQPRSRS